MSEGTVKLVIAAVLFLHGIAHVGPIATYLWIKFRPQDATGGWVAARTWLAPGLAPRPAKTIATVFWALSLIGFVCAALAFSGVILPGTLWRQLSIGSAIISTMGIIVFFGTWPMFNTLAALAVNVAVLVTQLITHWPPIEMFGR
jgi:hypothetical protein